MKKRTVSNEKQYFCVLWKAFVDMNFLESWKVGSENCDNSEFLCNVVGLLLDMCEIHEVGLFFFAWAR